MMDRAGPRDPRVALPIVQNQVTVTVVLVSGAKCNTGSNGVQHVGPRPRPAAAFGPVTEPDAHFAPETS